jgi:hypothetical protein
VPSAPNLLTFDMGFLRIEMRGDYRSDVRALAP